MYKKKILAMMSIVVISSCWALTFAQNKENKSFESFRGCKECRLSNGKCYVVIEALRAFQGNDSIAIEIFKEEYEIVNMRRYEKEWLLKKSHTWIIQYFALEESKIYYCRSKRFKPFDPVLLVE
jgi:hypothetical protein